MPSISLFRCLDTLKMLLETVVGTLQHKWSIRKKKKLYYHCFVKWMKESATSGFLLFRENHHLVFYNNTLIGSQKILSSLGDQNKFHNQTLTWKKILIILPNWTQESTVFICRPPNKENRQLMLRRYKFSDGFQARFFFF